MTTSNLYHGCGIVFDSELELPGIPRAHQQPTAQVRFDQVPKALQKVVTRGPCFETGPEGLLLHVPDVGGYLVREGREIIIEPVSGAREADLRLFLMGSAFGALLHQRGVLPLHASAVQVDNSYVAFMGNSGDGKSTQAAILHQHGYPLAADDICPVSLLPDGGVVAHRGFPRLKLWSDALDALRIEREGLEHSDCQRDKYNVTAQVPASGAALPLRALYVLADAEDDTTRIEPIKGQGCLPCLLEHTFRYQFVQGFDRATGHFRLCLQLMKTVPIFRLRRVRDMAQSSKLVTSLEVHWQSLEKSVHSSSLPAAA